MDEEFLKLALQLMGEEVISIKVQSRCLIIVG